MAEQVEYYNQFGNDYRNSILDCPEPHIWTTDYNDKGRVFQEMKKRVEQQEELIDKHFDKQHPVLDIGCGFGRQAFLVAKKGYHVVGTDTSPVFIDIVNELFQKNDLQGTFICLDIFDEAMEGTFQQILLLDVLEHVPTLKRKRFVERISFLMEPKGVLLLSLPSVKTRLTSQLNNRIRKFFTQHLSYFRNNEEHPFPIPQFMDVRSLMNSNFLFKDILHSADTDFYVLERR